MRQLGYDAIGLDIDYQKLAKAKVEYPSCCFVAGTSENLPFPSESFDSLFSVSTLQYVDAVKAIQEANRILKPGGRAVFIENLAGSPLAKVYRTLHRLRPYRSHATPKRHLALSKIPETFRAFESCNVTPFNLTTTALMPFGLIHEALTRSDFVKLEPVRAYGHLSRLDTRLLARFPRLSKSCWTALIQVTK